MRISLLGLLVLLSIPFTNGCGHRSSTVATRPIGADGPVSVAAPENKILASAPPDTTLEMADGDTLSFDRTGKVLRVASDTEIRFFDAATGSATSQRALPAERRVRESARDVLLLSTGETDPLFELYDLDRGTTSAIPKEWIRENGDNDDYPVISQRGDRLLVFHGVEHGMAKTTLYDTNRRTRIATVSANVGTHAGGALGGSLAPDGRHVFFCHSRESECVVENVDGSVAGTISTIVSGNGKWLIESPWDMQGGGTGRPRVRDAATLQIGASIPMPRGFVANIHRFVVCGETDRAVVIVPPKLFVVQLATGKMTARAEVGGDIEEGIRGLACAPDGKRVAYAVTGSIVLADLD